MNQTNPNLLPKYYILKKQIKALVEKRTDSVDAPIPSETKLIERFGVSRITVRRAIDELVKERYLYKLQGKGVYVEQDHEDQNLINITSCTSEIEALGMSPSRMVLKSEIVDSSLKQASDLKIRSKDLLFFLDRVYFADNIAVNRTKTYLPYSLIPNIEDFDFSSTSLYDVLENHFKLKITHAHRTIEAVSVSKEVADSLEIEEKTPVLLFKCLTYGICRNVERPIEQFTCYYRSDKFKFFINQVR